MIELNTVFHSSSLRPMYLFWQRGLVNPPIYVGDVEEERTICGPKVPVTISSPLFSIWISSPSDLILHKLSGILDVDFDLTSTE